MFAVVDALLPETLSPQAEYILASEAASAGRILLSRSQLATQAQRESAIDHLKRALAACKCSRTLTEKDFLIKDWPTWRMRILRRWMPVAISMLTAKSSALMRTMHSVRRISSSWACPGSSWKRAFPACSRMPPAAGCCGSRGFVQDAAGWVELNATADGLTAAPIPAGQEVLIVIGEGLGQGTDRSCLRN